MPLPKTAKKQKLKDRCPRHDYPCTCAMGHLYRFVEPVLLLILREKGRSYGYDLLGSLGEHAFTDGEIEKAVLYRTLRRLENNGYITSDWDTDEPGPARRVYTLTKAGQAHLREWGQVLTKVADSMTRFVRRVAADKSRN
jgi:PadR family transcriptional regulator PadR